MRNVFDRGRLLRRVPIAVLAGLIAVGPGGTVGHTAKGPTASPRPADDVRRLGPRVEPEQRWLVAPDFTFTVGPSLACCSRLSPVAQRTSCRPTRCSRAGSPTPSSSSTFRATFARDGRSRAATRPISELQAVVLRLRDDKAYPPA